MTVGRVGTPLPHGTVSARVDRMTSAGNPYSMEGEESQRDAVCTAFDRLLLLLDIEVDGNMPSQEEVDRIGEKKAN